MTQLDQYRVLGTTQMTPAIRGATEYLGTSWTIMPGMVARIVLMESATNHRGLMCPVEIWHGNTLFCHIDPWTSEEQNITIGPFLLPYQLRIRAVDISPPDSAAYAMVTLRLDARQKPQAHASVTSGPAASVAPSPPNAPEKTLDSSRRLG